MFSVTFFKKGNIVKEVKFKSLVEAEDFVFGELPDYPYDYQIYDMEKDKIIDEGELESNDDIVEGTMDMMFPDEESMEGFDLDDF